MSGKILITRPAAEAEEIAVAVRQRGFVPLIEPLLTIHHLPFSEPDHYDALVFTSVNGVRAAAAGMAGRQKPVFCVGERTASEALAAGWQDVKSAGGDVADLESMLAQSEFDDLKTIFYPSGFNISKNIEIKNFDVIRAVVYRADGADRLSPECLSCFDNSEVVAALFFSPRTADIFIELIGRHKRTAAVKSTKALCIADSVVKSVMRLSWADVQVASRPDRQSLMALLDGL